MRKEMGMYRGKALDFMARWVSGCLMTSDAGDEIFDGFGWVDVVPKSVGQQTPFTDRYGQPIFEGMHVKTRSDDYIHCNDSAIVAMDPDGMWVISKYEDEIHGMNINWDGFDSVEIIKD